jgi:hypothetical protein
MKLLLLFTFLFIPASDPPPVFKLMTVKKIWDQAPHNAFTDLIRYQERWYCVFRESDSHVDGAGRIRVLASKDGDDWESAGLITLEGRDLRDPKLALTPNNRLMIVAGATNLANRNADFQSIVCFSKDGKNWSAPQKVVIDSGAESSGGGNPWLWRVIWRKGEAFGVAYTWDSPSPPARQKMWAFVCRSRDGISYERLSNNFDELNEAALAFDDQNVLTIIFRSNDRPPQALITSTKYPFDNWTVGGMTVEGWESQLGGPALIRLANGLFIAAGRFYRERVHRTGVGLLDVESGAIKEKLMLPSSGDSSYPGLVWHKDQLWISYYSSHEGKAAIYLAKIELKR